MAHPSNIIPTQFVYATTNANHTPPGTNDYFYSITNSGASSTMTVFGGGVFDVSGVDQAAVTAGQVIEVGAGVTIYGRFTSVTTTDAAADASIFLYF
jgi:hypothetical protein